MLITTLTMICCLSSRASRSVANGILHLYHAHEAGIRVKLDVFIRHAYTIIAKAVRARHFLASTISTMGPEGHVIILEAQV